MKRIAAIIGLFLCVAAGAAEKPNVVLIVSDDQGWTDFGFMGHPKIKTPNLDRLANESLTFRRGYVTCSLCSPSLASIITGRYPHDTRFTGNEPPKPKEKEGARYKQPEFLAQVNELIDHLAGMPRFPAEFAKAGYVSLQTGKWWGGNFEKGGFTDGMSKGDPAAGGRHGDEGLKIGRQTMQPIFDFIEKAGSKPWMVWYAPMLPHQPHNPPDRLLQKYMYQTKSARMAKYWAMCEWFDETCGQLLDYLDNKKLADNTIVVFVTDNGWGQRPDADGPTPDSKLSPYDLGLRTPIMIRWSKKIAARFDDTAVSAIDIAPTLYAACGVAAPSGLPGVNLLDEKAVKERKSIFGSCGLHNAVDIRKPGANTTYRWCVSDGWKLIVPNPDTVAQPLLEGHKVAPELYEIAKDPEERSEISAANPERVAALKKLLDGWWKGN